MGLVATSVLPSNPFDNGANVIASECIAVCVEVREICSEALYENHLALCRSPVIWLTDVSASIHIETGLHKSGDPPFFAYQQPGAVDVLIELADFFVHFGDLCISVVSERCVGS